MRWKLLIIAPLLAATVGTGVCFGIVRLLAKPGGFLTEWATALALLAPVAAVTYASIFVYRHTARRRTLQAAATALLASTLILAALLLSLFLTNRRAPESLQPPTPNARRS